MSKRRFIGSLAALYLICTFAIASANPHGNVTKAEALIKKMFNNQVTIVRTFKAPRNLIGFVIKDKDNKLSIIYVDKDGDYLFSGTIVNSKGKDLTSVYQAKYITNSPATELFHAVQNTNWFEQGNPNAPHQIYVIAEPNCSACHYFYESIAPYIAQGQLKVRWILVAFLKPSSLGKAAAILSSQNPAQAFAKNEANFNEAMETGGITPLPSIKPQVKQAIADNLRFMNNYGFRVTPIILFRSASDNIRVIQGALPQNQVPSLISTIGKY